MTTVGLVGGLGPESTIDYYRRILETWQRDDPTSAPSIVIDSLDVRRGLHLVQHDRASLVEYLLASLCRLAGAGVDFAALTANTPHIVFDELAARAPVPLVSIVEVCAEDAERRALRRVSNGLPRPTCLCTTLRCDLPMEATAARGGERADERTGHGRRGADHWRRPSRSCRSPC